VIEFTAGSNVTLFSGILITGNDIVHRKNNTVISFNANAMNMSLENIQVNNNNLNSEVFETFAGSFLIFNSSSPSTTSATWNNISFTGNATNDTRLYESAFLAVLRGNATLSNLTIANNTMYDTYRGVEIVSLNPTSSDIVSGISITGNRFSSSNGSSRAILMSAANASQFRNITIQNNPELQTDHNAIDLSATSASTWDNINILSNPGIRSDSHNGISISSSSTSVWTNITIQSNNIYSEQAASIRLHATQASNYSGVSITSNTLRGNDSISTVTGLLLDLASGVSQINNLTVTSNNISNSIGVEVKSFDIQPFWTLSSNTFGSTNSDGWFIKDLASDKLPFFTLRDANTFSQSARIAFDDSGFINGVRPDNPGIFDIVSSSSGLGFYDNQLQLAVDKAVENDTVTLRTYEVFYGMTGSFIFRYLDPEVYTVSSPVVVSTSGLTITSNPTPVLQSDKTQAIIRNSSSSSQMIFDLRAPGITLQHLTLERQNATGSGGSVLVQASGITLSGLRFIGNATAGRPVTISNALNASIGDISLSRLEVGSGVITGTLINGSSINGTNAVPVITTGEFSSGVVIETTQAGTIGPVTISGSTLIGSGNQAIVLSRVNEVGTISGVLIQNNTLQNHQTAIVLPSVHVNTSIVSNIFSANDIHTLDAQSSPDARRTVLDNNTFDRLAADEAFVSSGLIVGNTITSAPQIFINIDRLEAYATLQEAVDGASEGDTINIASSGVYSDAQLNGANNGTVTVTVSGVTITSVVPDNFAVLRNTSASDAPVLDLQASGITVESIQVVRENATITSSGQGVIQLNAPFITLSGILFDGITSNELAAIGLVNTVEELSGLVISTNTFSGVFATMIEVVNQADTGQIGLLIDNNVTGSGIFATKDGSTTSGIVRLIAFEDKLVRLNAFDTVVVTNNLFGSDAVNSTLIPIIDTALIDSLTSLVTTIPADAGLYTVNSWALVETASGLSTTTNEENQTKFDQLTSALGGLVLQASFDALEAEVNFSSGLLVADFTTATFDPFNTQLTNSIDLLPLDGDPQYNTDYFDNTRTILIHTMIALEFISQEALSGLVNVTTSGLDVSNFVSPALFTTTRNSGLLLLDQISTSGVKAVFEGAPVLSNTVVSGLSNNLQTELSGLVFLNYDAFLTELNLVSGLVESNFEAAEWPAFETALTSGLLINNNVTSSGALATFDDVSLTSGTILSITTSIQTARGNLVFSGLEVLSGLINTTTSGLTQNNFADDVWNPFFEARSSGLLIVNAVASAGALATFEDAPLSSGAISFITTTLTTRFELLGLSFNGLDTLSGLVNLTTSGLDLTNFTEETRDPFSEARTSGIDLLDAILTSGAIARFDDQLVSETLITSISDDLLDRFNGLVYEGFVELSGLVSGDTSGLIESNFIESTWTPFNNARTSGLEVLAAIVSSGAVTRFEDVTLTSGTINEIRGTLQNAFDALDFKGYIELSGLVQLVTPLDASNFTDPASFEAARTSGILITTEVEASGAIAIFDGIRLSSGVIEVVFNALNDATSGLSLLGLDTLSGLVNTTTSGLDASNFISSTFAPFNEARTSGILVLDAITLSGVFTIYEGTLVTSGLIEQTINELNQSSGAVEFESYASLEAIVNQSSGLSVNDFEATEYTVFNEALQSGLSIQSAITASGILAEFENVRLTSGVIKFVDDAIRAAIPTLEFTGLATLSGLLETTSGLDETNFTLDTWTAFDAAFGSGTIIIGAANDLGAFAIYEDAPLSATAILDVTNQINTTYAALIYSGASELQGVVNTATGLNSGLYDTTYDSFFIALTSGQSILTNIASDTPRAMLGDDLITSGLIAEIQQAILTRQSDLVFKVAVTEDELYLMTIEPISISSITLDNELVLSGLSQQVEGDTLTFDFAGKELVGNLVITTEFSGLVILGSGTVNGNLVFSGINATVNNNLTVTGTITIDAISNNTWNQFGDAEQLIFTADGGRINLEGGTLTSGLVVSGLEKTNVISIGGTLTNVAVQIDAMSVIELLTAANNVTITKSITLTVNEDTTINIQGAGSISTLNVVANAGLLLDAESLVPQVVLDATPVLNSGTSRRYSSIQSAIDAAQDGQEIIISSGLFLEELNITNKSGLIIRGQGIGTTILGPTRSYATDNNSITLSSSNYITVMDLTIDGYANVGLGQVSTFRDGIHYVGSGGGNNNTFSGLEINNTDRRAISIFPMSTTGTVIQNNIIYNVTGQVTGTSNGAIGINFQGTGRIENNTVTQVHTGIILNVDNNSPEAEVIIRGNSITNFRDSSEHNSTWFNVGITTWPRKNEVIIIEDNLIESIYSVQIGMYLNFHSSGSIVRNNTITLSGSHVVGIDILNNKNGGYLLVGNIVSVGSGSTGIALSTVGTAASPMTLKDNVITNLFPDEVTDSGINQYEFLGFFINNTYPREVGLLISGSNDTKLFKDTPGDNATFVVFEGTKSIEGFAAPAVIYSEAGDLSTWVSGAETVLTNASIDFLTVVKSE
jgi:uncharacterized protein (UPF0303 family)